MRKSVLVSLLITVAFALLLVACGGGSDKPPFSEVSLDCTEDDVINRYGECANLTVNEEGGNSYSYPCTYQDKAGEIYINFSSDGKAEGIFWHYNAQSDEEQTSLLNSLVAEYTKKYGEPDLTNGVGTVWNTKNVGVTILAYEVVGNYNLQVVYTPRETDANGSPSLENSTDKTMSATTIYHKGEVAEGDGFRLTIDSVDATPEFMNYLEADLGKEYFFVSFELENTSSEAMDVSDFFKILADGQECNTISFTDKYNGVEWLDRYSALEAGRKVKNYISATVPEGWTEIQLLCADGSAFSFTREDLGDISATGTSTAETIYRVGDTMRKNGFEITMTKAVQTDYVPYLSTMYYEPDAGNHYVIMLFDIKNNATQAQRFEILSAFDVYVDDYSSNYTGFYADFEGLQDLSDQNYVDVLSGKSISGYKVLQVPDGWQKIELTSRQGTFEITPDAVTIQ